MIIFDWLRNAFSSLFGRQFIEKRKVTSTYRKKLKKPEVFYSSVKILDKTPENHTIGRKDFVAVIYQNKPFWGLFQCPCGCGAVISLSLQTVHKPHWKLRNTKNNRPTLYPSVWQNKGCCSHFWIKDGSVYFCDNTGAEPWIAKPEFYTNPHKKKSVRGRYWQA